MSKFRGPTDSIDEKYRRIRRQTLRNLLRHFYMFLHVAGGSGGDENTRSEVIRSERGGNEPITPRRHRTWARGIRRGKSLGFVAILHNVSL